MSPRIFFASVTLPDCPSRIAFLSIASILFGQTSRERFRSSSPLSTGIVRLSTNSLVWAANMREACTADGHS